MSPPEKTVEFLRKQDGWGKGQNYSVKENWPD
jgi:hypothetical protein